MNKSVLEAMKFIVDYISLNGATKSAQTRSQGKRWLFTMKAIDSARAILTQLGYLKISPMGYYMPQPETGRNDFLAHYPDKARAWVSQYERKEPLSYQYTYQNKGR